MQIETEEGDYGVSTLVHDTENALGCVSQKHADGEEVSIGKGKQVRVPRTLQCKAHCRL